MRAELTSAHERKPTPHRPPPASGLLQRRCACGGTPGLDGECAACRARRLAGQPPPAPAPARPAVAPAPHGATPAHERHAFGSVSVLPPGAKNEESQWPSIARAAILGGLAGGPLGAAVAAAGAAAAACPAAKKADRMTGCLQPVVIADDDGKNPTTAPSMAASQTIWEKCCIKYDVKATQTVNKKAFKTLDESPTATPTAEASALFKAAGASSCIQVFVPENFAQGGKVGKTISGGGATYDAGTANPKVVVVEGAKPEVVAHEVGHASGHLTHDAAATVMKPTGAHNVANASDVSSSVCTDARTGSVLTKTKDSCCMDFK